MARAKKQSDDGSALLRRLFPPMLATLAKEVPSSQSDWVFEHKYDGFRAVAAIGSPPVALWSRNSLDLRSRFPSITAALDDLESAPVVVDGEIVALDARGRPSFQLLQRSEGVDTIFFVFDILWLDGHDLRRQPIEERRELLDQWITIVEPQTDRIRVAERIETDAAEAMTEAAREGYEGLIAKRRESVYENRRSKNWLKLKAVRRQELAIVGFTPSKSDPKQIGALLLGYNDDRGSLVYGGKVGTGYSIRQRRELRTMLVRDAVDRSPLVDPPRMKDVTWVGPRLVAEVSFTEWTSDGKLRHPSFLGLRPDRKPDEVIRERPITAWSTKTKTTTMKKSSDVTKRSAKSSRGGGKNEVSVTLSSPDRLLYPRDGITKKDVAAYYEVMAEPILNALAGRPLALEHWNQGIDEPSWFQQNIGSEGPPWLTRVATPTRTSRRVVEHMVADRPESLRWLAQHSVLTIHTWSSRAGSLEEPDWLVLDLDPAEGKGIEQAVETALVIRRLFEEMEIPSVPKTSGKRGIHILVPLKSGHSHEDATEFACSTAAAVSSQVDSATVERSIVKRKGRLYLDCLQNGYGKTIVAPYSLRAIDGAPVSAPLKWSEVTKRLDPGRYNLKTMLKRLDKVGDLFEPLLEEGIRLPKLQ